MIRLRNVKIGDKFVLKEEAGVWKKVASNKARCVFGPDDAFNVERETDPDATVFVVPRDDAVRPGKGKGSVKAPEGAGGLVSVALVGSDEKVIHKTKLPEALAAICAGAERIRLEIPGEKEPVVFFVTDSGFDLVDGSLTLEVRK